MNITVSYEIGKSQVENFEDLVSEIFHSVHEIGRELVREALEQADESLMQSRDRERYRCKGFQKTCVKTILGPVEYKRRVYVDNAAAEKQHCVHLLDEVLDIKKIGLVSSDICRLAAEAVCQTSYRGAAKLISETTGLDISAQGVWDIVQRLGENQEAVVDRHAELAEAHQGVGQIETKILYEENDGIWLKLQGQSREENGVSKEMKVGIAYDGVTWEEGKNGQKRRSLDNKVAYASFDTAKEFRRKKEGLLASRFDVDVIDLRVLNGDGANWIQKQKGTNSISVLDEFHRNKKITECVKNKEFAGILQKLLYNKEINTLLDCIEAQINSTTDKDEIAGLRELQSYYTENKDALLGYYDRGIAIPETRAPGEVHHARLGSMESNVYTLIGNRMKDGRACWSIRGANHLALLLCLRHTTGFDYLFERLPQKPIIQQECEWKDTLPLFGASKVPEREGKGYEYPIRCDTSKVGSWFTNLSRSR